ncbi:MAG: hemolysin III family protein [Myxococcota bacterium]
MKQTGAAHGYSKREEVVHTITHGFGLLLSLVGLAVLLYAAFERGGTWHRLGCGVFGSTLVLLYAASTLYHGIPAARSKRLLQRLDRAAIYLLIAGTYTPFSLVSLQGGWGWTLLGLVWPIAGLGVALELGGARRREGLSLTLYLGLGWLIVVALGPLARSLEPVGLLLLVLGGLSYSIGVLFYSWRRLPYNHAVWHLHVMGGSAFHFAAVLVYVIPQAT